MKKRRARSRTLIWSKTRMCECCGRLVVLLRLPGWGSPDDHKWYIACYVKTWDGELYYDARRHSAHPRGKYARAAGSDFEEEPQETDPFFSL